MNANTQAKPRICKVLGVEAGEHFKVGTAEQEYYINEYGEMCFCGWEIWNLKCSEVLCEAINHPDWIIRKPRFTEDEITFMRYLYGCGVREIERPSDADSDVSAFAEKVGNGRRRMWLLPPCCLPSLRPGESVKLSEIVGGDGCDQ